jgi:hypothetical protein
MAADASAIPGVVVGDRYSGLPAPPTWWPRRRAWSCGQRRLDRRMEADPGWPRSASVARDDAVERLTDTSGRSTLLD